MKLTEKLINKYVTDILTGMKISKDSEEFSYYEERLRQELNKAIILSLIQNLDNMNEQILTEIFSRGDIAGGLQFLIDKNPDFEKIAVETLESYKTKFVDEYKKMLEKN